LKKRVFITGATGFIGRALTEKLCRDSAFVRILTGDVKKAENIFLNNHTIEIFDKDRNYDPVTVSMLMEESEVVINLAGASIGAKRWNEDYKELIYTSRVGMTKLLVDAINFCKKKPACFINISGTGFYGSGNDTVLNETSPDGDDFLASLCKDWEAEALKADYYGVRTVIMRTGLVLGKNSEALKKLLLSNKFLISTFHGSGKQWISWIHIADLINLFEFTFENESLTGIVNAVSPEPVTNKEFTNSLSKFRKTFLTLPIPGFMLKILAGEFAEYLITGQRVIPEKALNAGFTFGLPDLKSALAEILD